MRLAQKNVALFAALLTVVGGSISTVGRCEGNYPILGQPEAAAKRSGLIDELRSVTQRERDRLLEIVVRCEWPLITQDDLLSQIRDIPSKACDEAKRLYNIEFCEIR